MKISTTVGCAVALCAAFIGNVNAASVQYDSQLDLSNLQYPVTVNEIQGNAAANLIRFDLGAGWVGNMDFQLTTGPYNDFTTALGIALTTNPNDVLLADPSAFLELVDPETSVTQFFNDNVIDWVFYGWGSTVITAGGTANITDQFDPALVFDPTENYYAFIAGGSIIPAFVNVSLAVNEVSAVPIPAAVWLFGMGIVGLFGVGTNHQKTSKSS